MIGVTGIYADITGGVLRVTQVTPSTPAAGKLAKGDVLEAVDGASLNIQDPRHPLGFAINAAEGRDGKRQPPAFPQVSPPSRQRQIISSVCRDMSVSDRSVAFARQRSFVLG